jgi:Mrp family chromosome partitioning ATPase
MLGRRSKLPVVAEIPTSGDSQRVGALGRAQLAAYAGLTSSLDGAGVVFATGPGKAPVALGLATAALAEGRRVALLECDLAAPALAARLGLSPVPGLHEYLRGEAEPEQILQPLVLAGPASDRATEPLACIVAGEVEPAPVALLDSERCDQAIEKLRHAYDLLVIDGPPLEEEPDSLRALAEHSGATIVCGGQREIPRRLPLPATGLVFVA